MANEAFYLKSASLMETRSLAVAERPRALRVIEYFAKSLKVTQGYSK